MKTFKNVSLKPFLPRRGTWIGSFRKGCRSNSIWSGKRWHHAGGCQNAETWALWNRHSILSMFDSSFVTKLWRLLPHHSERSLGGAGSSDVRAENSQLPREPRQHRESAGRLHSRRWCCFHDTTVRPTGQRLTLLCVCISLRADADDHRVLQPWRPSKLPAGSCSGLHGIDVEFWWGEGTCCLQKHGLPARPT